jgi:PTH1 family peptidyl-tRNA hydrolase
MGFLSFIGSFFSRSSLPSQADFLFVGLGNPGDKYVRTRHNVGFRVADALCATYGKRWLGHECNADYCVTEKNAVVAKPTTFMNNSGDAVSSLIKKLGVSVASTVVVVDDFNIPLGSVRMRAGGSDGGHNGLKSISAQVGVNYPRLRIGIGPLPKGTDVISFVLGTFSDEENARLQEIIPRAVSALKLYMTDGITDVMNKYNT